MLKFKKSIHKRRLINKYIINTKIMKKQIITNKLNSLL